MEKSMNTLGKSMSTMEKPMNSANGKFQLKNSAKHRFFASKCSKQQGEVPQTEKQKRLKQQSAPIELYIYILYNYLYIVKYKEIDK